MLPFTVSSHPAGARILVVSQRRRAPHISRCTLYEFEELITRFDRADLVYPEVPPIRMWKRRFLRRGYDLLGRQPQLREAAPLVSRQYDLVFVCCEDIGDLLGLGPIAAWIGNGRKKICYVEEMWSADLPRRRHETVLLRQFDHVFLSCAGAVEPLQRDIGRPVSFMAPSVDAVTFFPGEDPPARGIEVYSMGRRSPTTHQAFLRLARERGWFYAYDTFAANRVIDPLDHRFLLANMIKRCKYFVANRAKIDHAETRGQEEIGSRHFEGAAGGAVMIGEPPQCQTFLDNFDWPDAVVPMNWNTDRPEAVIEALEADPDRVARIRRANMTNVLQRHDWVYRWERILQAAGLPLAAEAIERKKHLQHLAGFAHACSQAARV
ncbi:MAG: glycosyltransferase [Planctomycetota bacterium]